VARQPCTRDSGLDPELRTVGNRLVGVYPTPLVLFGILGVCILPYV
jgi:hypothetical protein